MYTRSKARANARAFPSSGGLRPPTPEAFPHNMVRSLSFTTRQFPQCSTHNAS